MRQIKSLRVCLTGAKKSQSSPVVAYVEPAATSKLTSSTRVCPSKAGNTETQISDSPAARPGPRATDTSAASVYACQIIPSKQVCFLIILGHSLIYFNFCFVEVQAAELRLCRQLRSDFVTGLSSGRAGDGEGGGSVTLMIYCIVEYWFEAARLSRQPWSDCTCKPAQLFRLDYVVCAF